jgi:anti-anti-sigma regulatory factor
LEFYTKKDDSLLIVEYLPGEEYTIDCFTDKNGEIMYSQARIRSRTLNGISVNSKPYNDEAINLIAKKINNSLKFRGAWFFQVKKDKNGKFKLMEIATRVAGTMAVSRMLCVNLPLLSLYDAMGMPVNIIANSFKVELDRALQAKFQIDIQYDTVYIDFDDTLIIDNMVNYKLIALLYKFREEGKKIVLVTRHIKIIADTLEQHKISKDIFDEIIVIDNAAKKSNCVQGKAIFIDDSFAERKEVLLNTNTPVFDISEAVELL